MVKGAFQICAKIAVCLTGRHFIKRKFRTLAELEGTAYLKSRLEILLINVPRKKILQLGKGEVDDPSGGLRPTIFYSMARWGVAWPDGV